MAPVIAVAILLILSAVPTEFADNNCPGKCSCSTSGNPGSPDFRYTVDCTGKLGDSNVAPQSIPPSTTELVLRNNKLEILSAQQFRTLTKLSKLDVSNNRLRRLPWDLFHFAPNLKELYLARNPLMCDCELYGAYNVSRFIPTFSGTCISTDDKSHAIRDLELWDFCRGCGAVKASGRSKRDGEYFVDVKANCQTRARVYCHNMNSASPQDFITLVSGPRRNFAYVHHYKLPQANKNQCERLSGGTQYSAAGLTNFTRVRVRMDVDAISIVTDDFTFSSTASGRSVHYGVAADCYSASKENCRKGRFMIDLTGSGFRLRDNVYWDHYGNPTDIDNMLDIDEERLRVYAECGGYCGGCRPHGRLLLELNSCATEGIKPCDTRLGMDDRTISDAQIRASSDYSIKSSASAGRLNHVPGAWCARTASKNEWLQVDLGKVMTVSGVATQGSSDSPSWVTRFKIKYSDDGVTWEPFEEIGREAELSANKDQHIVVTNWFSQRFRARFVRLNPTAWKTRICLRAELYGCETDIVSVIVKHKSDGRCWSPVSDKPCEPADGVALNLASFCLGEGVMMKFRGDRTIVHSCSGKCVHVSSKNVLLLRSGLCDTFRANASSGAIVHDGTGRCVALDDAKRLVLADCDVWKAFFEFTQRGLRPIKPKFDMPSPQYLTVGQPGWVHCQVLSDPRANIFWTKGLPWPNGATLNKLHFVEFSNGSLFVRKAGEVGDDGKYYCTAANTGGFEFKGVEVKVGAPPQLVLPPKNVTTQVNRTAVFDCQATGKLASKIFWFKRDRADSPPISIDKLGQRFVLFPNGSLRLSAVQKRDQAFYQCRAENPIGHATAQVFLRVLVPPRFTTTPRDRVVPSGSSPLISCRAFGDPLPTVAWTKASLSSLPGHFNVFLNGDLYVKAVRKSDEGEYTCRAWNGLASVSHKITLAVYISCRVDLLLHTSVQPEQQFFRVGERIRVHCNHGFQKQGDGNLTCLASGRWDKSMPKCSDINECHVAPFTKPARNRSKQHDCHEKATCENTLGSYDCKCIDGYAGDGRTCRAVCGPPNEPNGTWTPAKANYEMGEVVRIRCNGGYKLADDGSFRTDTCGKDARWSQATPSCQDVDECSLQGACGDTADCINTAGSFECRCREGYEKVGLKNCTVEKNRSIKTSNGKTFTFSRRMEELAKKIDRLAQNPASMGEMLSSLANSTDPGEGVLQPGDLLLAVQGLQTVLLTKSALKQGEVQEAEGASQVMRLLDKFAVQVAAGLSEANSSIDLHTDNVDMTVTAKKAGNFSRDFNFPNQTNPEQETAARITVPREVFSSYEENQHVIVTNFLYHELGEILPKRAVGAKKFDLNSVVLATSVHPRPVGKLSTPVTIVMRNEQPTRQDSVQRCVFWDFDRNPDMGGSLSDEGCHVTEGGPNGTVCKCDHMTAFTSMAVYDKELEFSLVLDVGFGILLLAALIALVRHLYVCCHSHAERSIIHINLCISILAELGLFVGGLKRTEIREVCILVTAVLQYLLIAMFSWMMVEVLQLFLTISSGKNRNKKRRKFFFLIGWLAPALAVGASLGVTQLEGYGNDEWCWVDYTTMLLWAFVGPAGAFIVGCLILLLVVACVRNRVVDTDDRRKVSISLLCMFVLTPVMAGTWVVAAIYVKNHELIMWQYVFAGSCALQGILLLIFCLMDKEIKNFTYIYQIKKIQSKERRNYYSTTDTVQYFGGNNTPDGKNYTVTRPSIKEPTDDMRGSSKRLSRLEAQASVDEAGAADYPTPIPESPATIDSAIQRDIEGNPIPETPGGAEVIRLQTYPPKRRGADNQSQHSSDSVNERRPDGAEYPELAYADRSGPRSSMPKSMETLLSSHSKLQQIPEKEPLLNRTNTYPHSESGLSDASSRLEGRNKDSDADSAYAPSLESSRRRSRRSRKRLEEEFGKCDRDSINRRKKSLRYSSGYLIGATVDEQQKQEKPHASL